jgi:archaeosine synthase beta-subunit
MSRSANFDITDGWILSSRGLKNKVDPGRPYLWLVEKERARSGEIENTATIFLTNRECGFRCLMCDLWKNTTNSSSPADTIPDQIEWALNQMPPTKHLKIYNSGSFFDNRAIPSSDYVRISELVSHFETLIVECHPKLIGESCVNFKKMLKPELQVAMGLETVHPGVLAKLNKQMNLQDFSDAASYLNQHGISSRAFILLRPPFLSEQEGIYWANRSLDFAFEEGVECCTVIPVRTGNGALEKLHELNLFDQPHIQSLEKVVEYGIKLKTGRVFADLWDISLFSSCDNCIDLRIERLRNMNFYQEIPVIVDCLCNNN